MAALLDDTTANGIFGVEAILPVQFWTSAARASRAEPERRLMLAVLHDALVTLRSHAGRRSGRSRHLVREVCLWFDSDSRAHPFAFGAICDVLGIDASYVRSAIRRRLLGRSYRREYAGRGRHQVERA